MSAVQVQEYVIYYPPLVKVIAGHLRTQALAYDDLGQPVLLVFEFRLKYNILFHSENDSLLLSFSRFVIAAFQINLWRPKISAFSDKH